MKHHNLRGLWSEDGVWHIAMEGKHFISWCGRNFAPQNWTLVSFPRDGMCATCWTFWGAIENTSEFVTVKLRREVVDYLKEQAKKGETYSDIIERLTKNEALHQWKETRE
jgi:hypothetical protein